LPRPRRRSSAGPSARHLEGGCPRALRWCSAVGFLHACFSSSLASVLMPGLSRHGDSFKNNAVPSVAQAMCNKRQVSSKRGSSSCISLRSTSNQSGG
jgi:hypothetical protein